MTVDCTGSDAAGPRPSRLRADRATPRICTHRFTVGDDVIDVDRHGNRLACLRWMQDAATAHSAARGGTFDRCIAARAGRFVRSRSIEYLRPAFLGDTPAILTRVPGFAPRSSPRRYLSVRADADPERAAMQRAPVR